MATSKKLEIIYHNGQPDGIRSIRRHLSTMTTYVIPRPLLSEAKKITGINRHGIYYLINENDENKIAQIYIGQTRNGVLRLDDHNRKKLFMEMVEEMDMATRISPFCSKQFCKMRTSRDG